MNRMKNIDEMRRKTVDRFVELSVQIKNVLLKNDNWHSEHVTD